MKTKKEIVQEITDFISPYVNTLFPGCIAGCASSEGKYQCGIGTQDGTVPITVSNIFDIASVTKAILHTIVLKKIPLSELDQKVIDIVPMTGRFRDRITVKHLLTFGVEYGDQKKQSQMMYRDDLIQAVLHGDLPFPPGMSYRYTNISSMLLTLFIEGKLQTAFDDLVKEFCRDVQMKTTGFYPSNFAQLEQIMRTEGGIGRGTVQDEGARLYGKPTGSAGLFSTVDDMLSFGQSFLGKNTFLPKNIIQQMSVSQFGKNNALTFGLGMGLRHQNECDLCDDTGAPLVVLKKNGFSGIHLCILPQNDFCFVVFANICYPTRPTAEKRDEFTRFHKKLLRLMYENRAILV